MSTSTSTAPAADNANNSDSDHDYVSEDNQVEPSDAQLVSSSKKKKKKKSKKSKIPQDIIDKVTEAVKEEHGEHSEAAKEENIRLALEHLKIMDVAKGKVGIGGINRKDMGEHKVGPTICFPADDLVVINVLWC